MAHQVRRSVIIGLGGTGRDAVLNVKRKYLEVYGTDYIPTTRFVVLDTTDASPLSLGGEQEIRLRPSEFVKMTVPNPKGVVQNNQEVRGWFPKGSVPMQAISAGAGQVRALGRLSLFANAQQVYQVIRNAFADVRAIKPQDDLGGFEPIGESVLVSVVGSMSGGTGSGTFIDVAYVCRQFTDAQDALVGYLLLPDVFTSKPATQNVQPNAYGALKELDMLMTAENRQHKRYTFGGNEISDEDPPFDIAYLVNNQNRKGTVFQDIEELTELLGLGIFVSSGETGKKAGDIWDNLRNFVLASQQIKGRKSHYTGFGVSELVLETESLSAELAHRIAIKTLDSCLLSRDQASIAQDVEDYVLANGLCEHEADQVIDALLPTGQFPRLNAPKPLQKNKVEDFVKRAFEHARLAETVVKKECAEKADELKTAQRERLSEEINGRLQRPNGLGYSIAFLSTLLAKLEEYRAEMLEERDDFRERIRLSEQRAKALQEDADEASKKFFGAAQALEDVRRRLKAFADEGAGLYAESTRRDEAIGFFASMITEVRTKQERLDDLMKRIGSIEGSLNQDLERLRSQRGSKRPFTVEVMPPDQMLEVDPSSSPEDFLIWLRGRGESVADLASLTNADLRGTIMKFASTRQQVQRLAALTIDEVLRGVSAERLARYLKSLAELADPMWRYDTSYFGSKAAEMIYLIGVYDRENSILDEKALGSLPSSSGAQLASTADPRRIFCYKVEASVPAFVVDNVRSYKNRYDNPDARFTFHIDTEWERDAPDLFPTADDESRQVWSLANASPFDLIKRQGQFYYAVSKKHGLATEDYLVKLDQGREKALKAFLKNAKLVAEIRQEIERQARDRGSEPVASALTAYVATLRTTPVVNQTSKLLIESEIKDVNGYIGQLTGV
jgi:hypothetical protein